MSIEYTTNWLIILDTFDYQEEGGGVKNPCYQEYYNV